MAVRKYKNWLVLWGVIACDSEDNTVIAYLKGPHKAADYVLKK